MKYAEFAEKIAAEYAKRFPKSMCRVNIYKGFGKSISIALYLAGNSEEVSGGYLANDMFNISLTTHLPDNFKEDTDELPNTMIMEKSRNHFWIKPDNTYMCYGRHEISYRKASGDAERLIKAAGKFMDKILYAVIDDIGNGKIHDNFIALVERKIKV